MIEAVEISEKFVKANRNVKRLFPDTWEVNMKQFKFVLQHLSIGENISHLEACTILLEDLEGNPIGQMWMMASCVELIESNKPSLI